MAAWRRMQFLVCLIALALLGGGCKERCAALTPMVEIILVKASIPAGKKVAQLELIGTLTGKTKKTKKLTLTQAGFSVDHGQFVLTFKESEVPRPTTLDLEVRALDGGGKTLASWKKKDSISPNGCNFWTLSSGATTDAGVPDKGPEDGGGDKDTQSDSGGKLPEVVLSATKQVADLEALGGESKDQIGSVVLCDVNGDGHDDLVVASARASGYKEIPGSANGRVYITYGQALASKKAVDLSSTADVDIRIFGSAPAEQLGYSLACGDLDGNQYMDLAMGAPQAEGERGRAYVLLGGAALKDSVDLAKEQLPMLVRGAAPGDRLGEDLAILAFEAQGKGYLALGAPGHDGAATAGGDAGPAADAGSDSGSKLDAGAGGDASAAAWPLKPRTNAGAVFLLAGSLIPLGKKVTVPLALQSRVVALQGGVAGEALGTRVAAGRLDPDLAEDLVAAGPGLDVIGDSAYGAVRVLRGRKLSGQTEVFDCAYKAAKGHSLTLYGSTKGHRFGEAVAVGDFDADGNDDIVAGAPGNARAYLFLGGAGSMPGSTQDPLTRRVASGDHKAEFAGKAGSLFGKTLAAVRRTLGQPPADLLVGAPEAEGSRGRLYWFRRIKGFQNKEVLDLTKSAEVRLRVLGAEAGDRLGSAVGGGFFNKGDTIPDLAGVAPLAGGSSRKTAGKAYLIKGKK